MNSLRVCSKRPHSIEICPSSRASLSKRSGFWRGTTHTLSVRITFSHSGSVHKAAAMKDEGRPGLARITPASLTMRPSFMMTRKFLSGSAMSLRLAIGSWRLSQSVVVSALRNQKPIIRWLVDKAVFLRQPPRPPAGQLSAQRLGLAGPGERRPGALLDETIQSREQFGIIRLPIKIVLPGAVAENEPHSATARSVPPPRSSSPIASNSLSAFLALRNR